MPTLLFNYVVMLTRAKIGKSKPKVCLVHIKHKIDKPTLALRKWFEVMPQEYNALFQNNT